MPSSKSQSPTRVKFFVGDGEVDLSDPKAVLNRLARRLLKAQAEKQARNYAHLVHPETGERPEIHMVVTDVTARNMQVRLVTDDPVMREWLRGQGHVIGEVTKAAEAA